MDSRTHQPPLAIETASLVRFLETAKPRAVAKAEAKLSATRSKRAVVAQKFQDACAAKFAEVQKGGVHAASPEMVALEKELQAIDEEISHARAELLKVRNEWWPRFDKEVAPQLAAALPQIELACTLLESASDLFRLVDNYTRDNAMGANGYSCSRVSDRIDDHITWLRRFLKNRAPQ